MGGFWGWFFAFVGVLAIFNAEKLPALKALMEEKLKISLDVAKEGSKRAKVKIKQVKTDMENKKMAEVNPTILVIILNVNGTNNLTKR